MMATHSLPLVVPANEEELPLTHVHTLQSDSSSASIPNNAEILVPEATTKKKAHEGGEEESASKHRKINGGNGAADITTAPRFSIPFEIAQQIILGTTLEAFNSVSSSPLEPTNAGPTNVELTNVEPTNVEPINEQPTNEETTNVETTNVEPTNVEPTNVEPTNVELTVLEPNLALHTSSEHETLESRTKIEPSAGSKKNLKFKFPSSKFYRKSILVMTQEASLMKRMDRERNRMDRARTVIIKRMRLAPDNDASVADISMVDNEEDGIQFVSDLPPISDPNTTQSIPVDSYSEDSYLEVPLPDLDATQPILEPPNDSLLIPLDLTLPFLLENYYELPDHFEPTENFQPIENFEPVDNFEIQQSQEIVICEEPTPPLENFDTPRPLRRIPSYLLPTHERPRRLLSEKRLAKRLIDLQMREIKVKDDGNCLFYAVAQQLHNDETGHTKIRENVVNWLFNNSDYLIDGAIPLASIEEENGKTWEQFCNEMSVDRTFGTNACLYAICEIYGVSIFAVFSTEGTEFILELQPSKLQREDILRLSFCDNNKHFNTLALDPTIDKNHEVDCHTWHCDSCTRENYDDEFDCFSCTASRFRKPGSWKCDVCSVENDADVLECITCKDCVPA